MRLSVLFFLLCLPAQAVRLVATSPQTAELLFQLGLGNQLVGVPEGSAYPPEAARLPKTGQLFSPSLEKVVSLRPDWVVLDSHNLNPAFASALRSFKIKTFLWKTLSPEEILKDGRRFFK